MLADLNNFNSLLATTKIGIIFICAGCLIAICMLCAVVFALGRRVGILESEKNEKQRMEFAREDAVKRSRAVLTGQIGEQFAPLLPNFPCHAADCRFFGKPIDYIGFKGLNEGEVEEVLFIEIKSGGSMLSRRERSLKEAIEKKRVRYVEVRI